jgi:hypothetical protein
MTKKKAQWWLESIVRNHGGSLHREALAVIFAEKAESRPTVRRRTARTTGKAVPLQHCEPTWGE